MCYTRLYKSRDKQKGCDHRWLVITQPCAPGLGFTNCAAFKDGRGTMAPAPKGFWASKDDCPWHGMKGSYDFNQTRMIDKIDVHRFRPRGCIVQ